MDCGARYIDNKNRFSLWNLWTYLHDYRYSKAAGLHQGFPIWLSRVTPWPGDSPADPGFLEKLLLVFQEIVFQESFPEDSKLLLDLALSTCDFLLKIEIANTKPWPKARLLNTSSLKTIRMTSSMKMQKSCTCKFVHILVQRLLSSLPIVT